jgi:polysaccharide pyruvyl transferase WcaK-like protein
MPKIFGREPALWLALAAMVIKTVAAFGVHVGPDQQALINAVVASAVGVAVALMTRDGVSAAVMGAAQSVLALAIGFGLHWSAEQQAMAMSLVAAAVGMWTRTQVTAPVAATATGKTLVPPTAGSRE